jgi:membrane-associated protease RseP (regulator of RpoE activity)
MSRTQADDEVLTDEQKYEIHIDVQGDGKVKAVVASDDASEKLEGFPKIMGKAIIVGPDGKRQEIDLSKGLRPFIFPPGAMPGRGPGGFMIGLACKPTSDDVRSELKLGKGSLTVVSVLDDTPAQKAGIQEGDVLTKVGKKPLVQLQDLIDAVAEAGKAGKTLNLQLIRDGKKVNVDVKPVERKQFSVPAMPNFEKILKGHPEMKELQKRLEELSKGDGFSIKMGEIGPGMIAPLPQVVDNAEVQRLKKQVENLTRQVKELKRTVDELKKAQQK